MSIYTRAFLEQRPFGTLAAVHLPAGMDPVPEDVLARLHPDERELARGMRGRRQIEFVGGRLALREAAGEIGPVLRGERGEPLCPPGVQVSISHKRTLAMALVGSGEGSVGLDVEELEPERMSIASRVLRPEELADVEALPEPERWRAVVGRFAVKEAVYKALHPHVYRYVKFSEALVRPGPVVELWLEGGEGPFEVEAWEESHHGLVIAVVRIQRVA